MSSPGIGKELEHQMEAQPASIQGLNGDERDMLIISMRKVGGTWIVVCRYGDDVWWTTGSPTNVCEGSTKIDFLQIPAEFRTVIKACMYRLKTRGREGGRRPSATGLVSSFDRIRTFAQHLSSLGIRSLSAISPLACLDYVQKSKAASGMGRWGPRSKLLSPAILAHRFRAVETLYELSQFTDDPMPRHPWPDTSSDYLSGNSRNARATGNTTPLMSDQVFVALFQKAWTLIQSGESLLDLRDELDVIADQHQGKSSTTVHDHKNRFLRQQGWKGNLASFSVSLSQLRTACYIVIASLSGCRSHEMGFLRTGAYYSTEDDQGERYWWMRSVSRKTGVGNTEWMIPDAAVSALRIMERWAGPFQERLKREIEGYEKSDPADLRIAVAQQHLGALFVGIDKSKGNQVRTLSGFQMNENLKAFAKLCGLRWALASHQFRRKFANYAARSRFGDLRYLKEHFKHWSLDMTIGYGLNESQEMALYLEIEDALDELKLSVVTEWMHTDERLAGGYGVSLMAWRVPDGGVALFKTRAHMIRAVATSTAIRSNGHAWCTADDNLCDGNDINPTRCGDGCNNAVIGRRHAPIYIALFNELKTLGDATDIGEGGRARVARDLGRCRAVLADLGCNQIEVAVS